MIEYKLLASDLDGTMFGEDCIAPKINIEMINKVCEIGKNVAIATGRGIHGAKDVAKTLGITKSGQYIVCLNGAAIYDASDLSLLESVYMEPNIVSSIIEEAKDLDIGLIAYINGSAYSNRETVPVAEYGTVLKVPVIIDPELGKHDIDKFNKILFRGEHEKVVAAEKLIVPLIDGKVNYMYSHPSLFEIFSINASKGAGLLRLAQMLGIKQEETIAVGDYYNDMAMIDAAGLGVAIKNSPKELLDLAGYVTTKSAEDGAIAEVIEKFML